MGFLSDMKKSREGGADCGGSIIFQNPLKEGFDQDRYGDGDWIHADLRTCKKTSRYDWSLHLYYNKLLHLIAAISIQQ